MQTVYRLGHTHKCFSHWILYMLVGLADEISMPIEHTITGIYQNKSFLYVYSLSSPYFVWTILQPSLTIQICPRAPSP